MQHTHPCGEQRVGRVSPLSLSILFIRLHVCAYPHVCTAARVAWVDYLFPPQVLDIKLIIMLSLQLLVSVKPHCQPSTLSFLRQASQWPCNPPMQQAASRLPESSVCLPSARITGAHHHTQVFVGVLGNWTQLLIFAQQGLNHPSHFPTWLCFIRDYLYLGAGGEESEMESQQRPPPSEAAVAWYKNKGPQS